MLMRSSTTRTAYRPHGSRSSNSAHAGPVTGPGAVRLQSGSGRSKVGATQQRAQGSHPGCFRLHNHKRGSGPATERWRFGPCRCRTIQIECHLPRACSTYQQDRCVFCAGACASDIKAFCKDTAPGEGRLAACLTKRVRAQRQGNVEGASVWQAKPLMSAAAVQWQLLMHLCCPVLSLDPCRAQGGRQVPGRAGCLQD